MRTHVTSAANTVRARCWHVCADCHRRVFVSRGQSWRAARPRCMACGCTALYTPDEAKALNVQVRD